MAPFKEPPKTAGDARKKGPVPLEGLFDPKAERGLRVVAASEAGRLATKEAPPTTALPQTVPDQGEADTAELVQGRRG